MNVLLYLRRKPRRKAHTRAISRKINNIVGRASQVRVRRARVCKLDECQVVFLVDWLAGEDDQGLPVYCSEQHANRDQQGAFVTEPDIRVAAAGGSRY
jgi:hypothetical protein